MRWMRTLSWMSVTLACVVGCTSPEMTSDARRDSDPRPIRVEAEDESQAVLADRLPNAGNEEPSELRPALHRSEPAEVHLANYLDSHL